MTNPRRTFDLPPELVDKVKALAAKRGTSASSVVRNLIEQIVDDGKTNVPPRPKTVVSRIQVIVAEDLVDDAKLIARREGMSLHHALSHKISQL